MSTRVASAAVNGRSAAVCVAGPPAGADGTRGSDLVERAEAELSSLDELALSAHPEVYARIHQTLSRELADIDGA